MARHRDDPRIWPNAGVRDRHAGSARDRLDQAVTELRRLTQDQIFQSLERLADVDVVREGSAVSVETIRRLRLWSAEHLRVAAELEAAARCCRLIEQELGQQIDALLAGWRRQEETVGDRGAYGPTGKSHRGVGLAGWLRVFSQRSGPAQELPDGEPATASPAAPQRVLMALSTQSGHVTDAPAADVAAMTLGPLELSVAGRRVVNWNSSKARAVFQYLLIHHGRPVRRDVLMELQWPNHTYTSARNNLNVALYSLRNTLAGPWQGLQPILYRNGCYVLNPDLRWWIDRDEFLAALRLAHLAPISEHRQQAVHHYQRAIQLYRGLLFEDDLADDWYLPEQRHLNELYLQALESLGKIYFDIGELTSAVRLGQLALRSDPCCESVHRLLMRCYASEHKQQLVSRQYRFCVDALRDELGVSPGVETLRLFRDLTSASS